jgi:hypothetical protein
MHVCHCFDFLCMIQNNEFKIWKRNRSAWKLSEGIEFEMQNTMEKIRITELSVGKTRVVLLFSKLHSETYWRIETKTDKFC